MASDSRADNAATGSVRRAVRPLLAALSRAVFGVCAVAVGVLTLLLAAGDSTAESGTVFVILGVAALVVGFVTISRLPRPEKKAAADEISSVESDNDSSQ